MVTSRIRIAFCDVASLAAQDAEALEEATSRVLRSGQYILGGEVRSLEHEIAVYVGVRHAIGVGNGTDALGLTLLGLGIGQGDEVLLEANGFFAAAEAILRTGARAVFLDTLDEGEMLRMLSERTRAVIVSHLHGAIRVPQAVVKLATQRNIHVVEDACQAFGARQQDRVAGSLGIAGCFSFYPTKVLGGVGDGGMIVTDDAELAERLRRLRRHGAHADDKYRHVLVGTNSRLDELQAACIRVRLARLGERIARRQAMAERYFARLARHSWLRLPARVSGDRPTYYSFSVHCARRNELATWLHEHEVEAPVHFPIPIHRQEALRSLEGRVAPLARAEAYAATQLSLPCHSTLSEDDVDFVCDRVDDFARSAL